MVKEQAKTSVEQNKESRNRSIYSQRIFDKRAKEEEKIVFSTNTTEPPVAAGATLALVQRRPSPEKYQVLERGQGCPPGAESSRGTKAAHGAGGRERHANRGLLGLIYYPLSSEQAHKEDC